MTDLLALDNEARMRDYATDDLLQEQAKKNHDFVQYTRTGLTAIEKIDNVYAYKIFTFFSREMDRDNKLLISQQTLAEYFQVSRVTISNAIKELEDKNLIAIYKLGKQNIYCLNANAVWTRERDKLHLARFKASIIISKEEQTAIKKTQMRQISLKLDS